MRSLTQLLERIATATERQAQASERIARLLETNSQNNVSSTVDAVPQPQQPDQQATAPFPNNLPEEVSTAQAARLLERFTHPCDIHNA